MLQSLRQALAVARKDLRSELRTRYALNALGMFVVVTVGVFSFSAGIADLSPAVSAAMIWTGMFFAGVSGLGRSFISEEERGTTLLLRLSVPATPVYVGKLLVNLGLALLSNALMALLFSTLMIGVTIASPVDFAIAVILTSIGLASTLTIIAAIIARTSSKGALYPVLSFPMILPLLMLGVPLLEDAFAGRNDAGEGTVLLLLLYTTTLVIVSYTLFDLLWKE